MLPPFKKINISSLNTIQSPLDALELSDPLSGRFSAPAGQSLAALRVTHHGNGTAIAASAGSSAIVAHSQTKVGGEFFGGEAGISASSGAGIGIFAKGGTAAGYFEGPVQVHGSMRVSEDVFVDGDVKLTGADCAEYFAISAGAEIEPGSVMVMGDDGKLSLCRQEGDVRVVGVVSGAGSFRPGIRLNISLSSRPDSVPIAIIGRTYCRVEAVERPISVGDMLVSSDLPGHARNSRLPSRGSVIGKALENLDHGTGLIPILVMPS